MISKKQQILIGVAILAVVVLALGDFLSIIPLNSTADPYYDYPLTVVYSNTSSTVSFVVNFAEKAPYAISTAPLTMTANCYQQQDTSRSRTVFNKRSVHVFIDGKEIANSYHYPEGAYPGEVPNYELVSALTKVGPVCC